MEPKKALWDKAFPGIFVKNPVMWSGLAKVRNWIIRSALKENWSDYDKIEEVMKLIEKWKEEDNI